MFDVGTLIQSVGTIIALLGVIASFALTRRGQRQDLRLATQEAVRAERAERAGAASAQRAENAASLTIDTLTRIAEALETLAAERAAGPSLTRPAPRARPSWSLRNDGGDQYLLRNTGDADAHDVQLAADESLWHAGPWPAASVLHPGQSLAFAAARTEDTTDSTITVEWSARPDSEDRDSWRYPLPQATPLS